MFRFAFLILALASLTASAGNPKATNHHVILITVDGGAAYYLNDPKAPIPNLRKLAREGVTAEGMKVANPAVTWPNHTTLVTGVPAAKHSVLYNALVVPDPKGGWNREPERSKMELVAVPTVYDFLHDKGYKTAAVNWPCTPGATTLDFNFPDVRNQLRYTTPQLIKELTAAKILDESSPEAFSNIIGPKRDKIWADTASYLMRTHRPNLMLLHFLISDSIQHRFGPQCPEAYEALAIVDGHIGELFQTLEETGLRNRTSVLITADHGFVRVYKQIVCAAILRKAGLLTTEDGKARVQTISYGGSTMVYLHSQKTKEEDRKKVIELFKNQEGVDRILGPKDFPKLGFPSPIKNPHMGDLLIAAKDGYTFSGPDMVNEAIIPTREGGAGTHGFLASNPKMKAMFIATGPGIARGKKIGTVSNIDVAPTLAYLLGEKFPHADGRVLKEIMARP